MSTALVVVSFTAVFALAFRTRPRGVALKQWMQGLMVTFFPSFYNTFLLPRVFAAMTSRIDIEPLRSGILPMLSSAPKVALDDFHESELVVVDPEVKDSIKIISSKRLDDMKLALSHYEVGQKASMCNCVDRIVEEALPHIARLKDGRKVTLQTCVIYALNKERGAYFPSIHWDTDWLQFPGVAGFQIWFLVHNIADEGNMFLISTPELHSDDPPMKFVATKDGGMQKQFHDKSKHECPLKRFKSIADARLKFQYLDLKPGDCLIMCKRQLHMSDPRLLLKGKKNDRLAVNFRVIVRNEAGKIPFWPFHAYNYACNQRLRYQARLLTGGESAPLLEVSRHEMLDLIWNREWK